MRRKDTNGRKQIERCGIEREGGGKEKEKVNVMKENN